MRIELWWIMFMEEGSIVIFCMQGRGLTCDKSHLFYFIWVNLGWVLDISERTSALLFHQGGNDGEMYAFDAKKGVIYCLLYVKPSGMGGHGLEMTCDNSEHVVRSVCVFVCVYLCESVCVCVCVCLSVDILNGAPCASIVSIDLLFHKHRSHVNVYSDFPHVLVCVCRL